MEKNVAKINSKDCVFSSVGAAFLVVAKMVCDFRSPSGAAFNNKTQVKLNKDLPYKSATPMKLSKEI
jgi:hypothetical protein